MDKKYLLIPISIIIFALMLFILKPNTETKESADEKQKIINYYETPQKINKKDKDLNLTYVQCVDYSDEFRSAGDKWKKENKFNWDSYLDEGYTLDQITTAIHHFSGWNWSSSWRKEQLIANSDYLKIKQQANQQVSDYLGESLPKGMTVSPNYPRLEIVQYIESLKNNTAIDIAAIKPTVDDIAALITDTNIPNDIILSLLDRVEDLSASVGYKEREPLSLAGYAALHTRIEVIQYLIERNHIKGDSYLGNPLEWALIALNSEKKDKKPVVKIIRMLQSQGLKIRNNSDFHDENGLNGRVMFGISYRFTFDELAQLKNSYKLDLLTIPLNEDLIHLEENQLLKQRLLEEKEAFIASSLGENYDLHLLNSCTKKENEIKEAVKIRPSNEVINEISRGNDFQGTLERLSNIDPSLAGCFYRDNKRVSYASIDNQEVYTLIFKKKYSEAINLLKNMELSKSQKATLLWQNSNNLEFLPYLINNGFMTEPFNFDRFLAFNRKLNIKNLEALENMGIDTFGLDHHKRTLLYYMVGQKDIEMINHLINAGYPVGDEFFDDPLHSILANAQPDATTKEMIDLIMPLTSSIDEYHLSRMKRIMIKFPDFYETLTKKHPQLSVRKDTPLPISICQRTLNVFRNKY